jgi:hypothetical protein
MGAPREVRLDPSPIYKKKWRITLWDGSKVDFGARGYDDYTRHKNPLRMRNYIRRHGGIINKEMEDETSAARVHEQMLNVDKSTRQHWGTRGIKTPGFWSRWLLWSQPGLGKAIKFMQKKFKIRFT